ncbi:RNA exonuclease NGL2 [Suhomyces tanzawaensis NRRL Y-17324]|uniref:RNA exonuclease NGL2 n=1 Tax=Suhomyces tanzawaensis NRRL Y-17324 TaxID=984487 RepID=A0A1E4SF49_9ASCO|nr:RNA exonuclease NGL2 [Suhomyces tanzawaensis NRRL Y-17324]ODV78120.1 RNA exonuclease NGL2 [Suhomyces tanzawaensis NRRL Y-17324]
MDPSKLTPEYIEEQRRLRNLRKEAKAQELRDQGIEPEGEEKEKLFIARLLAPIHHETKEVNGFPIKIMTYNVLAQALIRRKLFPTNGPALKWGYRSRALLAELKHYGADIMCLQELDYIQYNSFWKKEFEKLGYSSKYYRSNVKNHGLAIVYRENFFICKHQSFINYDSERTPENEQVQLPIPRTITQNVGFMCYLEFHPSLLQKHPHLSEKNGLIIGTTHLFWHPFGTFERARQTYLVLYKFKAFRETLTKILGNSKGFYNFFAGDMNSQPFDSPYLAITSKPVTFKGRASTVISCSLSYQYSKNRGTVEGADEDDDDEDEEGGNVEKFGKDQPRDPVPDHFEPTEDQLKLAKQMEDVHNALDMRAISLYSVGYNKVHPENSGLDNDRNEPSFSNWAHTWRGLLDYIFVVSSWDLKQDFSERPDTLEELEQQNVRLVGLLKLPLPQEMGPEPSGQPRIGQYPSDHLCLMAEVELI